LLHIDARERKKTRDRRREGSRSATHPTRRRSEKRSRKRNESVVVFSFSSSYVTSYSFNITTSSSILRDTIVVV